MIRPYLRDLINDHKSPMRTDKVINNESQFAEWKIQLVMLNNCVSSKHFEETPYLYSASKPVEIFMDSNTDDIVDELFDTILQRFQKSRETSNKRGNKFIHEKWKFIHKIDMKRGESYTDSPEWLKNKIAAINPKKLKWW